MSRGMEDQDRQAEIITGAIGNPILSVPIRLKQRSQRRWRPRGRRDVRGTCEAARQAWDTGRATDMIVDRGGLQANRTDFPVRDLGISLEHYGRLGFATREYDGGGYGYVTRDDIEIHLEVISDNSRAAPCSAYLWVDDADALAQAWS